MATKKSILGAHDNPLQCIRNLKFLHIRYETQDCVPCFRRGLSSSAMFTGRKFGLRALPRMLATGKLPTSDIILLGEIGQLPEIHNIQPIQQRDYILFLSIFKSIN